MWIAYCLSPGGHAQSSESGNSRLCLSRHAARQQPPGRVLGETVLCPPLSSIEMQDHRNHVMRRAREYALVGLFVTGALVLMVASYASQRRLFQRAVVSPIPTSVRAIRSHASFGLGSHTYIFRFSIDDNDVPAVLGSRPFKKIFHVKYVDGMFDYETGPRTELSETRDCPSQSFTRWRRS
jgi:hypothetical protein